MDDVGQISSDLVQEGVKVGKKITQEGVKTLGSLGKQALGQKPPDPAQIVEELTKRDQEFKEKAIKEILSRLQRQKAEEERLAQKREQEKKDWSAIQREKLAPPQIQRPELPKILPQVAKQRPETKVGWGAG